MTSIRDLYTRKLKPHELVICLDEKTSVQPRTRSTPTKPALTENVPVRLEHQYVRGAVRKRRKTAIRHLERGGYRPS